MSLTDLINAVSSDAFEKVLKNMQSRELRNLIGLVDPDMIQRGLVKAELLDTMQREICMELKKQIGDNK